MANYDLKQFDAKLSAAKDWLSKEYRNLRTGRATPAILDGIQVEAYGSMMPLKQVASLGVEDARTLRVTPYDTGLIKDIERAIVASDLGVGTVTDGAGIRVTFPELTGERRQEFVKLAKGKLEEARTAVRIARDEVWKNVQAREKEGTLTEDDKFSLKDELQKKVDKTNDELEQMFKKKEEEMSA